MRDHWDAYHALNMTHYKPMLESYDITRVFIDFAHQLESAVMLYVCFLGGGGRGGVGTLNMTHYHGRSHRGLSIVSGG